jgi:16S rRNA (adenine1518-N6/adenine1519-N6)-dimethyltransferase
VEVFTAQHDGPFLLPPSEIEDAMFFPLAVISDWLSARPQDFAPGFWEVWKKLRAES